MGIFILLIKDHGTIKGFTCCGPVYISPLCVCVCVYHIFKCIVFYFFSFCWHCRIINFTYVRMLMNICFLFPPLPVRFCLSVCLSTYIFIYSTWECVCAAGRMEGRLLTFTVSGKLQPSFMSIKAIKRLSMWMEISMNYHIWGRDWITSSVPSLALAPSSRCILSLTHSFVKKKTTRILKWDSPLILQHIVVPFAGQKETQGEIK